MNSQYNRWTVISRIFPIGRRPKCLCKCECGTIKVVRIDALKSGRSSSCGCYSKEIHKAHPANLKHGHRQRNTSEYNTYLRAKSRCQNKINKDYAGYGAKGIEFLFTSFQEFLDELGLKPTPLHTIDRINNHGNYEKGNVRWATRKEQANNRG